MNSQIAATDTRDRLGRTPHDTHPEDFPLPLLRAVDADPDVYRKARLAAVRDVLGVDAELNSGDCEADLRTGKHVLLRRGFIAAQQRVVPDLGEGIIEVIASTEGRKRDSLKVYNNGWNFRAFRKWPAMTNNHDWSLNTLGRWLEWDIVSFKGGPALKLVGKFALYNDVAREKWELYRHGDMRAFSIEWIPDEVKEAFDPDTGMFIGFDCLKNTLIGCAAVTMPADEDALTTLMRSGKLSADEAVSYQRAIKRDLGVVYTVSHLDPPDAADTATKGRCDDGAPVIANAPADAAAGRSADEVYDEGRELQADGSHERKIVQEDDGWHVYSEDGTKHLGGPYDTKAEAVDRLKQVEGHKSGAASDWKCSATRGLPVVEDAWDGAAAQASVFDWAGWPDNPDPGKAAKAFLAHDAANGDLKGSYKLPFAKVSGGKLVAVRAGLNAAASRLNQTDIPQATKDAAQSVIDSYKPKKASLTDAGKSMRYALDQLAIALRQRLTAANPGAFVRGPMSDQIDVAVDAIMGPAMIFMQVLSDLKMGADSLYWNEDEEEGGEALGMAVMGGGDPVDDAIDVLERATLRGAALLDAMDAAWSGLTDVVKLLDVDEATETQPEPTAPAAPGAPTAPWSEPGSPEGVPMAPILGESEVEQQGAPAAATRIGKKIAATRLERLQQCASCLDQASEHVRAVISEASDSELDTPMAASVEDILDDLLIDVKRSKLDDLAEKVVELEQIAPPDETTELLASMAELVREPTPKRKASGDYADVLLGAIADLCHKRPAVQP